MKIIYSKNREKIEKILFKVLDFSRRIRFIIIY